jgi:glycosyltransferase involved in cell wall biosynthesis
MSEEMRSDLWNGAHVIPHGVDIERFQPIDQSSAVEMVRWNPDSRHVLFPYDPSRPVKGFSVAERVVSQVREEVHIPVKLHSVYGVPHEEIPYYMNAADALLLTSRREGFPNSVKEALACNLPVVATDVGGVHNYLSDVSNSYVGATEQELVKHLTSIIKSGQRSDGRHHIVDLDLDQMAEDILSVYRSALS